MAAPSSPTNPLPTAAVSTPADAQVWDPVRYRREAGFVADLGMPVLDLLAPQPGERILDLGCGEGRLTQALIKAGGSVLGIDTSPEQIAQAQAEGIDAVVMDAQALFVPERSFDAVFSNAVLHWMRDIDAVLAGVHKALKPGGRFVGEFGGAGNVKAIRVALRMAVRRYGLDPNALDPWYFPETNAFSARLQANGFTVRSVELIPRPTPLPGDITGWLDTFAESFLAALAPEERETALSDMVTALAPVLQDAAGAWSADYVRLRFAAEKT